jgi:hypothetical protein
MGGGIFVAALAGVVLQALSFMPAMKGVLLINLPRSVKKGRESHKKNTRRKCAVIWRLVMTVRI